MVALKGVTTALGLPCDPIPDPKADLTAWTNSFVNIQCYDTLKVNAVLNEIDGYSHNRKKKTQVPTIFGMNFQAVSVGQKLIETSVGSGGYLDAMGTPSARLLEEIQFADAAIGEWTAELQKEGLTDSTLVIITAKHGQSPIDSQRYVGITSSGPVTTSPSMLINDCLPPSESNSGGQIGPTEDDVSLLWLKRSCNAETEVGILETQSPTSNNIAGIGEIFYGQSIDQLFNPPGIPPNGDPRSPDIAVAPNVGVTYSGSTAKQAEHGGFSHDDTNVMILVSNPNIAHQDPYNAGTDVASCSNYPAGARAKPSELAGGSATRHGSTAGNFFREEMTQSIGSRNFPAGISQVPAFVLRPRDRKVGMIEYLRG